MPSAVVFAYHNVGVRCLQVLLAHGVDVSLVVTHNDVPGENIWFASVAKLAKEMRIPVVTPDDPNVRDNVEMLSRLQPDFLFSFYYRHMLKPEILRIPRRGAYNMHGSLLPKFRGRVPVNWAVIKGATETGATLHAMAEKPDAGAIVDQMAVPILPDDSAKEVFDKVVVAAEITLNRCLPLLIEGRANYTEQDLSKGSYFGGRKAEDGRIDWRRPALEIHNLVRGVTRPYPGAFSDTARGKLLVWRTRLLAASDAGAPQIMARDSRIVARCGDAGIVEILDAQLNGTMLTANDLPLALN